MKPLTGRFYTIANGHLSYEIDDAEADFIFKLSTVIIQEFGFEAKPPAFGLDAPYIDHWKGNVWLTVSWDPWSGCFVMAYSEAGDAMVQAIGAYLDAHLSKLQSEG